MAFSIRELHWSERDKVCSLLSDFSDYKRDRDFWVWINRVIGSDNSIVVVAVKNDEIIGHYAIVPHIIKWKGKTLKAGLGIHAFIHPEYRGKVLMYKITELAYKIAENQNIKFVYGFPNVNYRYIQKKIEGWKEISLFNSIEIKPRPKDENTNYEMLPVSKNSSDLFILDELLSRNNQSDLIRVHKNINYYRDRYINHPQNLYECFFLKTNEHYVGFIVYKIFNETRGHIIDFLKTPEVTEKEIIDLSLEYFKDKVTSVILWPINTIFKKELINHYEYRENFQTFFGIKVLDEKNTIQYDELLEFNNWELMMGDSDAF